MELDTLSNKQLIAALKACATLDIALCEEAHIRSFAYQADWQPGIDIATYDNGGGDNLLIIIKGDAILIKGFDHESEVSPYAQEEYGIWPGIYDGAPAELLAMLDNDAFERDDVTFCFWRTTNTGTWQQGPVEFPNNEDDGSNWLLAAIRTTAKEFIDYATYYYQDDFNKMTPAKVHQVFKQYELAQ
ncbi:hypothetical protein [Shewanella sp.]|uniref:hypothetical protein n=1 Tax=Shewanella sp. TaxID=50422 RepID=UPI003A97FC12